MSNVGGEDVSAGMRQRWSEALWRFARAPKMTDQRERQADVIEAIKQQLDDVCTVQQLRVHYQTSAALCDQIVRALYPDDPFLADPHRTRDVAYGLRYVELMTGRRMSAFESLPSWIGEWAVL